MKLFYTSESCSLASSYQNEFQVDYDEAVPVLWGFRTNHDPPTRFHSQLLKYVNLSGFKL